MRHIATYRETTQLGGGSWGLWDLWDSWDLLGFFAFAVLVSAGIETARGEGGAGGGALRLEFRPVAGERALATGRASLGQVGQDLVLTRLDGLVSELALQRADGSWLEGREWYGALSAGKGRLQVDADGVRPGEYRAIRFRVGLDAAIDAIDPARWPAGHALNPEVNGLHWGWQGGYVFLAVEGHGGRGEETQGFSYHLAGAAVPMRVELPVVFTGGGPLTLTISLDVEKLLAGVDPVRDGFSTHSRPGDGLAERMKAGASGAFRVVKVSDDLLQPASAGPEVAPLPAGTRAYRLDVSQRFPQVQLPADNPLSVEGVALGKRLFHDPQLSGNGTQSCASCHQQATAFSDPRKRSVGAEGELGLRHAMPLFNLAWHREMFWDGRARTLRDQILVPIQDPLEMNETLERVVAKVERDPTYPQQFAGAFGGAGVSVGQLAKAIEQFLLSLVSQNSRFDRAARRLEALSEEEKRGLQLFVTESDPGRGLRGADCFHCHGGTLFTNHQFHNNGLTLVSGDIGRMAATGEEADRGKFKVPSLRNVAATAPYMHDGRFATLEEVVEHYDQGVQPSATLDPNLAKHRGGRLDLSAEEKRALVAFLKTLTDEAFLRGEPALLTPAILAEISRTP